MSVGRIVAWCAALLLVAIALVIAACTVAQVMPAEQKQTPQPAATLAATPAVVQEPANPLTATTAPALAHGEELWVIPANNPYGAAGQEGADFLNGGALSTGAPGVARGGRGSGAARGGGDGGGGGGGGGGGAIGGGGGRGRAAGGAAGGGGFGGGGVGPLPRGRGATPTMAATVIPGSPILAARRADGTLVPVPLKHTDVSAQISGYIASVGVTQQFTNPYSQKIEAVYVFPLPENAGVSDFVMTIGDRHIRGIIRERAEAERIYQQARSQGFVASLLTQERPNIFTQNVANIEPGKQIDIEVRYFHTLSYADGWFEWAFPMVVGPRYNPPGSTAGIGAAPRTTPGVTGQPTEVAYLRPEERSGHDIALNVQLDAGMKVEELQSVNHRIRRGAGSGERMLVQLDPADSIPNKDFVLRYRVAGDQVKTGMFVQKNKEGTGGWFTLMIVPPAELKSLPRRGVEMVFVVDTSGSMNGQPIAQAKAAVQLALASMSPQDTFQIVKFAARAEQAFPRPLDVTPDTIAMAQRYVAAMQGEGGTEMLQGMNAAMDFPHDPNRTRVVAFMTDGYIGNETQVLRALSKNLQDSRVFSFGVGNSVNRYLLDAMARLGNGTASYLSLNEPAEPVMRAYFERISHPALTDVRISFATQGGGMKVTETYPQRFPELFVGHPIIVTGQFTGTPVGDVLVSGRVGDRKMQYQLSAAGSVEQNPAIATVWARARITDLHDESIYEGRNVTADVRSTALTYGLMSDFTSFVAVDSTRVTEGDHGVRVSVPVPVPEGVKYETTVPERVTGGGGRGPS